MDPRDPANRSQLGGGADFATTEWSIVLSASESRGAERKSALSRLCQTYWLPLYSFALRRTADSHQAQDLTQAFFAELLEKHYVDAADPERGRFRAYLITAFKHFLAKQWERARAQKRGGGTAHLSLDFAAAEAALAPTMSAQLSAERTFQRQWALTLLEGVLQRLQREEERAGRGRQFRLLKDALVQRPSQGLYAQVAEELAGSAAAMRMAASRLRQRYRELLREEIAQTVASEEDIEDEIRHLFEIFASD